MNTPTVLRKILERKRSEVSERAANISLTDLIERAASEREPRDFIAAMPENLRQ